MRLDELQVTELEALRNQLKQEEDVLTTYQTKQSNHLQSHIEREMSELENRVTLRKELLERRVGHFSFLFFFFRKIKSKKQVTAL